MATQFSDPGLGGQSGFASQYTPIQFAPLVSLTGPVVAPVAPAAPEAPQAGMPRMLLPQESGYEFSSTFEGRPIGDVTRMGSPAGRQAELANLANAAGMLMSPLMMANYVLTGTSPAQMFGVGDWRSAQAGPGGQLPQGLMPQGGLSGMFGGIRDLLFGAPQPSVALGDMRAPAGAPNQGMNVAVFNDAYQLAMSSGADDLAATNAASTAASLVSQGVDPITAVTIAAQYATGAAGPQLPEMPNVAQNAYALPSGAQSMPGVAAMNESLAQFAQGGPAAVAPGAFAVGMGPTESSYDFSSQGYGGGTAGETGAPGESSYGLDR